MSAGTGFTSFRISGRGFKRDDDQKKDVHHEAAMDQLVPIAILPLVLFQIASPLPV